MQASHERCEQAVWTVSLHRHVQHMYKTKTRCYSSRLNMPTIESIMRRVPMWNVSTLTCRHVLYATAELSLRSCIEIKIALFEHNRSVYVHLVCWTRLAGTFSNRSTEATISASLPAWVVSTTHVGANRQHYRRVEPTTLVTDEPIRCDCIAVYHVYGHNSDCWGQTVYLCCWFSLLTWSTLTYAWFVIYAERIVERCNTSARQNKTAL